ncbi:MAG: hypothetical protein ACOY0T_02300 [Myxococcota bacterium]
MSVAVALALRGQHSRPTRPENSEPASDEGPAPALAGSAEARPLTRRTPNPAPAGSGAATVTYLADTSEDPQVIEAALREVLNVYSSRSSRKLAPDAELDRVIIKRLHAPQPSVVAAAVAAARIPLMTAKPSDAVANAVVDMASTEGSSARRQAALEALNLIRPDRRSPSVLSAFEQALSANEPQLLSVALFAIAQSGASLATLPQVNRANLARRVLELKDHADPGVRGRALGVLADVEWLVPSDARYASGERALGDAHAYVRGMAADLLFRCAEPMGIHALVRLSADLEPARYELRDFTELDGRPGVLQHSVLGRPRVAEAALLAMLALSENLADVERLNLSLTNQNTDELVLQNAELARNWYRANAARIPRQPKPKQE